MAGSASGDVNHVYQSGHNGTAWEFSPVHCTISIVGNWGGNELIQYWWGVTPNKTRFPKNKEEHSIIWALDVRGIVSDRGTPWAQADWKDAGSVGSIGGIVMESSWDDDWGIPERIPQKRYRLVIPAGRTISRQVYNYTVNWKVGAGSNVSEASFDPELEVGE